MQLTKREKGENGKEEQEGAEGARAAAPSERRRSRKARRINQCDSRREQEGASASKCGSRKSSSGSLKRGQCARSLELASRRKPGTTSPLRPSRGNGEQERQVLWGCYGVLWAVASNCPHSAFHSGVTGCCQHLPSRENTGALWGRRWKLGKSLISTT